jgi:hypothetical protein
MYQYDLMEAYSVRGRARMKQLEDIHRDPNAKNAPPSRSLKNNKMISKDLNWRPERLSSDRPLAAINDEYCSKCRRMLESTGDYVINLYITDTNGVSFQHWDAHHLERSARHGCAICNIVWQSHRRARLTLAHGEEFPMSYDFGSFMSTDHNAKREIFAVRFYPFTLFEKSGEMMPNQMPLITLTLEPSACKLGAQYHIGLD